MTVSELAREYEAQYRIASCKADALTPLLCVFRGRELEILRKRINFYYGMACECKRIAFMLCGFDSEDDNGLY